MSDFKISAPTGKELSKVTLGMKAKRLVGNTLRAGADFLNKSSMIADKNSDEMAKKFKEKQLNAAQRINKVIK